MPKSKNRKDHKKKLQAFKDKRKKELDSLKKKLMDNYISAQNKALADKESHSSTQEIMPDIDVALDDAVAPENVVEVNVDEIIDESKETK